MFIQKNPSDQRISVIEMDLPSLVQNIDHHIVCFHIPQLGKSFYQKYDKSWALLSCESAIRKFIETKYKDQEFLSIRYQVEKFSLSYCQDQPIPLQAIAQTYFKPQTIIKIKFIEIESKNKHNVYKMQIKIKINPFKSVSLNYFQNQQLKIRDILKTYKLNESRDYCSLVFKKKTGQISKLKPDKRLNDYELQFAQLQQQIIQLGLFLQSLSFYTDQIKRVRQYNANYQIEYNKFLNIICQDQNDKTDIKKRISEIPQMIEIIDQYTLMIFVFLTSPYYNPQIYRKIMKNHENKNEQERRDTQKEIVYGLMINKVMQLPICLTDNPLYILWKKSDIQVGKIIKSEVFIKGIFQLPKLQEKEEFAVCSVKHITARTLSSIPQIQSDSDCVFLPYTYFYVEDDQSQVIKLVEISLPNHDEGDNILIWVDDKLKTGKLESNGIIKKDYPKLNLIQISSNSILQKWIIQFWPVFFQKKVRFITNMNRKEDQHGGLQTIKIIRKYFKYTPVMLYISDISKCQYILSQQPEIDKTNILVEKGRKQLFKFINQMIEQKNEIKASQQLCKCMIY